MHKHLILTCVRCSEKKERPHLCLTLPDSACFSRPLRNPIALSFVTSNSPNDIPAVSYSTVYPLTMFLRVVSAQILILAAL